MWPVSGRAGGTRWANCSPPASLRAPSPASPSPRALCSQARTISPAPQISSSRLPALIHLPSAPRPHPQICPPPPHLGPSAGLATFLTSDSGPCFYCCPPRPGHQCPPIGRSWPPPGPSSSRPWPHSGEPVGSDWCSTSKSQHSERAFSARPCAGGGERSKQPAISGSSMSPWWGASGRLLHLPGSPAPPTAPGW